MVVTGGWLTEPLPCKESAILAIGNGKFNVIFVHDLIDNYHIATL